MASAALGRLPHEGEVDALTVVVERARRLLPMDKAVRGSGSLDSSDPYAKILYDSAVASSDGVEVRTSAASVRTHCLKQTLRPQWNDVPGRCTFLIEVVRGCSMEIGVWDKDKLSDDLIGGAFIDTHWCEPGTKWSGWVQLHTELGKGGGLLRRKTAPKASLGKKAGEVFLSLQWTGKPEKRQQLLGNADDTNQRYVGPPAALGDSALLLLSGASRSGQSQQLATPPKLPPPPSSSPPRQLGSGQALAGSSARLAHSFELIDQPHLLRRDFETSLLAPGSAPVIVRTIIWSLLRYVLAHGDAGSLEGGALCAFIIDGVPHQAAWDGAAPDRGGIPRTFAEAQASDETAALLRSRRRTSRHARAAIIEDSLNGASPQSRRRREKREAAAAAAEQAAVKAELAEELESERKHRRFWLLSPLTVGVVAELAFDRAVNPPALRELFTILHAILGACVALGVHVVAAELARDAAHGHLSALWGIPCPLEHGNSTGLGGVLGTLRLRAAAIVNAVASGAMVLSPHNALPLSQRVWNRQIAPAAPPPVPGAIRQRRMDPARKLAPRPSLSVELYNSGYFPDSDDEKDDQPLPPLMGVAAKSAAAKAQRLADLLAAEQSAASTLAIEAAHEIKEEAVPRPRSEWTALAERVYLDLVGAIESGTTWEALPMAIDIHVSVARAYVTNPCLPSCSHCRVEVLEIGVAAASSSRTGHGRNRPAHHLTAEAVAVCHMPGGWLYTFRLPRSLALAWAVAASTAVRQVVPIMVLDSRAPSSTFLIQPPTATEELTVAEAGAGHTDVAQVTQREQSSAATNRQNSPSCGPPLPGLLTYRRIQSGPCSYARPSCSPIEGKGKEQARANNEPKSMLWQADGCRQVTVAVRSSVVPVRAPRPTEAQLKLLHQLENRAEALAESRRGVKVQLRLVGGRGLKQMDRFGKADPFITVQLGGSAALRAAKEAADKNDELAIACLQRPIGKTSVVKNSLAPHWDETVELRLPSVVVNAADARIEARIFDWDAVGSNDPMGMVSLPLKQVLAHHYATDQVVREKALADAGLRSLRDPETERKSREEPQAEPHAEPMTGEDGADSGVHEELGVWLQLRPDNGVFADQDGDANASGHLASPREERARPKPRNELRISAVRAGGGLRVMDKGLFGRGKGSSDPFVELTCGTGAKKKKGAGHKAATSIKKKDLTPNWGDEVLSVHLHESEDPATPVRLTVYDWDRLGSNDFMGEVRLTLQDILEEVTAAEARYVDSGGATPADDDDSDIEGLDPAIRQSSDNDGNGSDDGRLMDNDGKSIPVRESKQEHTTMAVDAANAARRLCGRRIKRTLVGPETSLSDSEKIADGSEKFGVDGDDGKGGRGSISFRVSWVHNEEIEIARLAALADVQGEVQLSAEYERLPQSSAEIALQHADFLELLRHEGPIWEAPVTIVCQTPPPLCEPLEVDVLTTTVDGTALAGIAYLPFGGRTRRKEAPEEGKLRFRLTPACPIQCLRVVPLLVHDATRADENYEARGDEHFYLRIESASIVPPGGPAEDKPSAATSALQAKRDQETASKSAKAAIAKRKLSVALDVLEARNLKKMDALGKADPYVKLSCSNQSKVEHKTHVIRNTLEPSWEKKAAEAGIPGEHFVFNGVQGEATIGLTIYDLDKGSADDPMGQVILAMASMSVGTDTGRSWHKLQPMLGCTEPQGELCLRCRVDVDLKADATNATSASVRISRRLATLVVDTVPVPLPPPFDETGWGTSTVIGAGRSSATSLENVVVAHELWSDLSTAVGKGNKLVRSIANVDAVRSAAQAESTRRSGAISLHEAAHLDGAAILENERQAVHSWAPFVGGELVCAQCGRVATAQLDIGTRWPPCVGMHPPPSDTFLRPRVDQLHASALAPFETHRHEMAWLCRPALPNASASVTALERRHNRQQHGRRGRRGRRGRSGHRPVPVTQEHVEQGWDASPAGVVG